MSSVLAQGPRLSADRVWQTLDKATFAVVAYTNPAGEPRSSGVMCVTSGRRLVMVTAPGSWKARQISDGDQVAVTVPVRRGGLLSLIAPVPPATISFRATATIHEPGSVDVEQLATRLAKLLPEERANACVIELAPQGVFLTYGIGVSLRAMAKPSQAVARVPVS